MIPCSRISYPVRQYIAQFVQSPPASPGYPAHKELSTGPCLCLLSHCTLLTVCASRPRSCLSACDKLPIKSCGMSEHDDWPRGHSPCSADLHAGHVGARRGLSGDPPGPQVNKDGSLYLWQRLCSLTCCQFKHLCMHQSCSACLLCTH